MIVIKSVLPTYRDHGDSRVVVCTKMRLVIWKRKAFSLFDSALDWPVLEYVKFRSEHRVLWLGVHLLGPDFQHVYGGDTIIFADTPVNIMRIWRVQRCWREIRAHLCMLAVGMITHARLGKACALQAFPELVRMIWALAGGCAWICASD
jgi:hypothetical protein